MLGGSDSKAHSIFEGRMVVVEAHTCNNGDDIPRQQNGNRLKAHLKLCLQGQQQPNLKGTRLLMYINSAAVATALIFLIYALLRMPGQQHAPQEPCKTTLPRGQQAAKVEFAVRDASRMQCLQEVNDALMVSWQPGALHSFVGSCSCCPTEGAVACMCQAAQLLGG